MHEKLESSLKILWKKSRFTSYFYQLCTFIKSDEIPTIAMHESEMRPALYYNEKFLDSLEIKNITALLVHEMLHVIFRHDHRSFSMKNPYLQNLSQDMVVNSFIKENIKTFFSGENQREAILELPENLPLIPPYFYRETGIKDPKWEDVYYWLLEGGKTKLSEFIDEIDKMFKNLMPDTSKNKKGRNKQKDPLFENKNSKKENDSKGFVFTDSNGKPLKTGSHVFKETSVSNRLNTNAKKITAIASNDPGANQDRFFSLMTKIMSSPKKTDISSWEKKIKSIVDSTAHSNKTEYTYKKFNRRYFANGIYAPGKIMKDKERIIAAVDVSASVTSNPGELERAFGVIENLIKTYKTELVLMDETLFIPREENGIFKKETNLTKKFFYKSGDWRKIKSGSGGTTFFSPLFNEYLKKRNETIIVITDGFIHDIGKLNPYKNTLWLIGKGGNQKFVPPFGKTFFIEND
jgi:predicted metal-dependent peptidase